MSANEITERDRFPLLDERGQQMLNRIRQHPHAPKFNYHCGEKLTATGLQLVRQFAEDLRRGIPLDGDGHPDWLYDHVRHCWDDVPFFRERDQLLRSRRSIADCVLVDREPTALAAGSQDSQLDGRAPTLARSAHNQSADSCSFSAIPFTDRNDLRRQPWSFVPDSADLDELIVYSTSGTTGNLLSVICHPSVPASYLPLFEAALAEYGVYIEGGDRVSILHIAAQHSTYTLHSTMSYFGGAGFAKVNLNPAEWRSRDDRQAFIDDCDAEIYTGDPFAFLELSKLALETRPKAILSCATTLLPATRDQLAAHFRCPVIDIYSMNETGPIAYAWQDYHRIFPHRIYIEIVDVGGNVLPSGQVGEIVVTGGINPWMPLLRYRTEDLGAVQVVDGHPCLVNFSGRTPVDFYCVDGSLVRSIDVTVALYTIRRNVWCWPTGLVQVLLFIIIFYDAKLYSDLILHVIYVGMQFYGWYYWTIGRSESEQREIVISRLTQKQLKMWIAMTTITTAIWGYAMATWTDAALPYADAFTTVASLVAQYLLARKYLENWLFWIVVDVVAIGVYFYKALIPTSILYSAFLVLAIIGLATWTRKLTVQRIAGVPV